MDYKIVVTKDAEEDLDRFIKYLIFEKESLQAAQNAIIKKVTGAMYDKKTSTWTL